MHCPLFWISNPYFISYLECREPLYFIFSRDFLFLFHVGGEAKIQYINYKYYKNSHTRTGESTCVPTLDAAGLRLLLENPADPRPLLGGRGLREVQTSGQEDGDTFQWQSHLICLYTCVLQVTSDINVFACFFGDIGKKYQIYLFFNNVCICTLIQSLDLSPCPCQRS